MSFEPLADAAAPDAVGVFERMAVLEQQVARQASLIGALRAALRMSCAVNERFVARADLLSTPWWRSAKQALGLGSRGDD
jgi:hypothetical protein